MGESDDDAGDYKRRDKFRSERARGYDADGGGNTGGGGGGGGGWAGSSAGSQRNGSSAAAAAAGWTTSSGSARAASARGYGGSRYSSPPPPGAMMGPGGGGGSGGGGSGRRGPPPPPPPHHHHHHHHHDMPPAKRSRNDWDDGRGYDSGYQRSSHHHYDDYERGRGSSYSSRGGGGSHQASDDNVQPPMMSFKAYLGTQDDSISDEEAIKKYAEYKLEFRRQQLNEFFVNHKDEEWFKLKYHPEESVKRQEELKADVLKRVDVFERFWKQCKFDKISLDGDRADDILKVLDSVVILLEDGNDNDLKILDEEPEGKSNDDKRSDSSSKKTDSRKDDSKSAPRFAPSAPDTSAVTTTATAGDASAPDDEAPKPEMSEEQLELQKKAKEYLEEKGDAEEKRGKKRKFGEEEESDKEDTVTPGEEEPELESKKPANEEQGADSKEPEGEEKKPKAEVQDQDQDQSMEEDSAKKVEEAAEVVSEAGEEDSPKPRPLHKTSSIFLRNLAPTITKQEVEAMCKKYQGFLRAAIADPQPERRWFRRGWVTFERNVKIKDICFNLNSTRLRDCELGPIVNRDLTRRIRTVNGITVDKKVVRNDIKLAARVITNLDKKWGLWQQAKDSKENNGGSEAAAKVDDASAGAASEEVIGLGSTNPVLHNITDYLIEEASAEEEELLGKNNDLEDGEEGEEGTNISRDEELLQVLDRLLFYLRVVHSVDFYNHSEYPNEDEMPNRCGIMHARGTVTTGKVTAAEIEEYCSAFEKKMGSFLQPRPNLNEEEAQKLGMKNEDDEVEKFVSANTQELGKDKWLCPLSGKKFRGPDFVKKHIFNKHGEKVDEVKKEVQFYNNYLRDPKRPQLPENPQNKSGASGGSGAGAPGHRMRDPPGPPHRDPYNYSGYPREATSYPVYDHRDRYDRGGGYERSGGFGRSGGRRPPPDHYMSRNSRNNPNFQRLGGGPPPAGPGTRFGNDHHGGGRPIITYRDLDAPRDQDDF